MPVLGQMGDKLMFCNVLITGGVLKVRILMEGVVFFAEGGVLGFEKGDFLVQFQGDGVLIANVALEEPCRKCEVGRAGDSALKGGTQNLTSLTAGTMLRGTRRGWVPP